MSSIQDKYYSGWKKYAILDEQLNFLINSVNITKAPGGSELVICCSQAWYLNHWAIMIFNWINWYNQYNSSSCDIVS